jgi:hypothetical protein
MDVRSGLLGAALVLGTACFVSAQEVDAPLPSRAVAVSPAAPLAISPAEQVQRLERWAADYKEWHDWFVRWRNTREPGWWSSRQRREMPQPPDWLPGVCATVIDESGPAVDACAAWRESTTDEAAAEMQQRIAQARADTEAPEYTKWWERVHVDALWPMTKAGTSAFGVAGMHATLHLTNRLQVFLAPGVILMRLPSLAGDMTWSAATDWGFSYRLTNFRIPATARPAALHLNLARVWVLGSSAVAMPGELYLAGLSLSLKQR